MSRDILDIIRKLNGGNVLANQPDEETYINLFKENIWLYKDLEEGKYYFFSNFDAESNGLMQIENNILKNEALKEGEISPSDTYLILFWEVEEITEFVYSNIIKMEENEFFFKKYIFYYTKKEYADFLKWIKDIPCGEHLLENSINKLSEPSETLDNDYAQFFIKLLVKVPVINPVFPKAELVDFNDMVKSKLNGTQSNYRKTLIDLDNLISEAIEEYGDDSNIIAEELYKKLMVE